MRFSRGVLLVLFFVLTSFSAYAQTRELRVGVAVAPSYQTIPEWKATFERRLAYASRIFQNEFAIKFVPVAYWEWMTPETPGLDVLLNDLMTRFPLKDVDMVIGLMRLTDLSQMQGLNDLEAIARARAFSGYLVIRYPHDKLFKIQEETVLTHELGHLFAAVHTTEENTIMAPYVDRQLPSRFDDANHQIILQTRTISFAKGITGLTPDMLQALLNSYSKMASNHQTYDFYYSLGVFYLQLGQKDEALKVWKSALQMNDKDPQLHYDFGVLSLLQGHLDDAVHHLGSAVSLYSLPSQRKDKAKALTSLGDAHMQSENLLAAYDAWSRAAAILPDDQNLKTNLAVLQMKRGQADDAGKVFTQVVQSDPNNLKALINLAKSTYEMGKYNEAIEYFNLALEKLSKQPGGFQAAQLTEIHYYLGHTYMKMNRTADALKEYRSACENNPSVECHKQLGQSLFQNQQWDAAIQEFIGVLQIDRSDPNIYGALGAAYMQKNDPQKAASFFQEGLKYATDTSVAAAFHKNLGYLYLNNRQPKEAEQEFRASLAKDWNQPEAHMGLVIVLLQAGENNAARDSLRNILRIDPGNKKAQEILKQMDAATQAAAQQGVVTT